MSAWTVSQTSTSNRPPSKSVISSRIQLSTTITLQYYDYYQAILLIRNNRLDSVSATISVQYSCVAASEPHFLPQSDLPNNHFHNLVHNLSTHSTSLIVSCSIYLFMLINWHTPLSPSEDCLTSLRCATSTPTRSLCPQVHNTDLLLGRSTTVLLSMMPNKKSRDA